MHQVGFGRKWEVFSMNEMHVEPTFLFDCITSGNGYCKCVMTSMAESKHVFLNHQLHSKNEGEWPM